MNIDELILKLIVIAVVLELYEISWQKAGTLMGMLARMYQHYAKSVFLFLLMHPTFYFSIALVMMSEYNFYALLLLGIKAIDIITKMKLLEQVFIQKEVTHEMSLMLLAPIHPLLSYLGVLAYPPLVYMIFS